MSDRSIDFLFFSCVWVIKKCQITTKYAYLNLCVCGIMEK